MIGLIWKLDDEECQTRRFKLSIRILNNIIQKALNGKKITKKTELPKMV